MADILGSPYRGRKAAGYDAKREEMRKWVDENDLVALMMTGERGHVLDLPVGTGRFLDLWRTMGLRVTGVDLSEDMLEIAKTRPGGRRCSLKTGDAGDLEYDDRHFDLCVCVRLLHLLPEPSMREVLVELCRVTRKQIVLTVQLGEKYRAGRDTATHDERKFRAHVGRLGWKIRHEKRITAAGWWVMALTRAR